MLCGKLRSVGDRGLDYDAAFRAAAFAYVQAIAERNGGVVTRQELEDFRFRAERIALIDQGRGVRNPVQLPGTISILSTKKSNYQDETGPDGLLRYDFPPGDPERGDNRKLRQAARLRLPLIWLQEVVPAVFAPILPVFMAAEETAMRRYVVAIDADQLAMVPGLSGSDSVIERRYAARISKQRLHQPVFRGGVMLAYRRQCAVCGLRHAELLDAAHIIEDGLPGGEPVVSNGLALCKIHHAAYDRKILGISPDLVVHLAPGVLAEVDGPMLRHGLQDFHGQSLSVVPNTKRDKPDRERLAARFSRFLDAS